MSKSSEGTTAPIDVIIVGGQLGSGKTTFLRKLLRQVDPSSTGLLVNEGASGGIDQVTLQIPGIRMEDLFGCMCCKSIDDTVSSLLKLKASSNNYRLKRVVVEASGLADVQSLLNELLVDFRFLLNFRIATVVTLIDATSSTQLCKDEIAHADVVLLTHLDVLPLHERLPTFQSLKQRMEPLARGQLVMALNVGGGDILDTIKSVAKSHSERLKAVMSPSTRRASNLSHGHVETHFFEKQVTFSSTDCDEFGKALALFGPALKRFKMMCPDRDGAGSWLVNITAGKFQQLERLEVNHETDARFFMIAETNVIESVLRFITIHSEAVT